MTTSAPRFYVDAPLSVGEPMDVPREKRRHFAARRVRMGDSVLLFNNDGYEYFAVVKATHPQNAKAITLEITARQARDATPAYPLHLCQVVLEPSRMDMVVQKATELGAHSVVLLASDYGQYANPSPAKCAHWHRIMVSAAEQCGRSTLPKLIGPIGIADALSAHAHAVVLDPRAAPPFADIATRKPPECALFVGPEGGFSLAEYDAFVAKGVPMVRLGRTILRAETASIAALTLAQAVWGDWR